jgi:hypothetical protein
MVTRLQRLALTQSKKDFQSINIKLTSHFRLYLSTSDFEKEKRSKSKKKIIDV